MINNDISLLASGFKERVYLFLEEAKNQGLDVFVFEGLRSKERQFELFGKGRSAATLRKYGVPAKYASPFVVPVTWTLQSNHLTGKAIDVVFDKNSDPKIRVPSWNGDYRKLTKIANAFGLRSLAPQDVCHFESL